MAGGEEEAKPFLGRYQLQKKIAVGGMAELYLAKVSGVGGFQKQVVVKRILPQLAESEELFRMFLDEARIAATLDHPNVVQIYDSCEENGEYFMAMEYLDGTDLRTLRKVLADREAALPWEHALHIIGNISAGLHYAHEKCDFDNNPLGIVHRDVTPHNIFLTRDGGIKLVDFGIAKAQGRMTETANGTLKGKLAYMSPEQCRGEAIDRRSDIYSLGIILYELTTGGRLYSSATEYELINEIVEGDIREPSSFMKYPSSLETIVLRCLRKDPEERYQTAQEIQADLEKFAQEHRLLLSALSFASFLKPLLNDATKVADERWKHRQDSASLRMSGAEPKAPRRSPSIVAEMRDSNRPKTTPQKSTPSRSAPKAKTEPEALTDSIPSAIVDPSSALSALLKNDEFDNDELTARVPSEMLEQLRSEEREQVEQELDGQGVEHASSPAATISSNLVRRKSQASEPETSDLQTSESDEQGVSRAKPKEPISPSVPALGDIPDKNSKLSTKKETQSVLDEKRSSTATTAGKDAIPRKVAGGRSGTVLANPLNEAKLDFQIGKPGSLWIWALGLVLVAGAILFFLMTSPSSDNSGPETQPAAASEKDSRRTLTITSSGKAKVWLLLGRTPIRHSLDTAIAATADIDNPQVRVEYDGYASKEVVLGAETMSRDSSGQTYYDHTVKLHPPGQEESGSEITAVVFDAGTRAVVRSSGDAPAILRIKSVPTAAKTWLFVGESYPELTLKNIAADSDVHLRMEVSGAPPVFRSVLAGEFDDNGRAAISVRVSADTRTKDAGGEDAEASSEAKDSDARKRRRRRRKPNAPLSPTPDWAR